MITVIWIFTFIGFWLCYQASARAQLTAPNQVEQWIHTNPGYGQKIGVGWMILGLVISMLVFGVGSGIFAYLITLTMISSLVIILAPLGLINKQTVAVVALLSIILEISI